MEWTEDQCSLVHPTKGNIEVRIEAGCTQLDHDVALEPIREREEARSRTALRCYSFGRTVILRLMSTGWTVVDECPILDKIPDRV